MLRTQLSSDRQACGIIRQQGLIRVLLSTCVSDSIKIGTWYILAALTFLWLPLGQKVFAEGRTDTLKNTEVVKNILFPKKGTVEFSGLDLGLIMNESFVSTYLFHSGLNYHVTERWGLGADLAMALKNADKSERQCIENFYNDPTSKVNAECGPADDPEIAKANADAGKTVANMGPAYVGIREIKNIVAAYAIWSPLYGKQLLLYKATSYFDFFIIAGAAMVMSDYYPKSTTLRNGTQSRGPLVDGQLQSGADPSNSSLYGIEGRPDPQKSSNFATVLGIGQKYHFAKHYHVKLELRNYTMFGTESGFDSFFTLWGGLGVRF